jgi:hypothetical protein
LLQESRPQIRRVEKLALNRSADAMHDAGAELATARQLVGDLLKECVAAIDTDRPGSGHNHIQLSIGKAQRLARPPVGHDQGRSGEKNNTTGWVWAAAAWFIFARRSPIAAFGYDDK